MMRRHSPPWKAALLIACLLVLCAWGQGEGATYYVSTTGSNTSPYDTWEKAASVPSSAVTAGNAGGGPHTLYIAPGTYNDALVMTDADWAGGTIIGTVAHGSIAPASKGQVILSKANAHGLSATLATSLTVKNITFTGTNSSYDSINFSAAGLVLDNIYAHDSGRYLWRSSTGATGFVVTNSRFEGADSNIGIYLLNDSAGSFSYCVFSNSATKPLATFTTTARGFSADSSGNTTISNSVILGSDEIAFRQGGAGTTTINNSIVTGGKQNSNGNYAIQRAAGAVVVNNSILMAGGLAQAGSMAVTNGTVTLNNSTTSDGPRFTHHARHGYIVPCVDDAVNNAYAVALEAMLRTRGQKGTWFVDVGPLVSDRLTSARNLSESYWSGVGSMEVGCHSQSSSALTVTGNVTNATGITKTGKTINIDRTVNTIVVSDTVTVTDFRSKTWTAIAAELTTAGCSVGALATNLVGGMLGEALADSSGAQASPYVPQLYFPAGSPPAISTEGFLWSEIVNSKTVLESASYLNHAVFSFATPGGVSSADINSYIQSAGYGGNRQVLSASMGNYILSSFDVYNGAGLTYGWLIDGSDTNLIRNVKFLAETAAQFGCIFYVVLHNASEATLAQWALILDTLAEYPDITVTSMHDALTTIKDGGDWATSDNKTYTRTWTDQSNYALHPSSPAAYVRNDLRATMGCTDASGVNICRYYPAGWWFSGAYGLRHASMPGGM